MLQHRLERDAIQVGTLAGTYEFIASDNPVLYYQPDSSRPMPFDSSNILELPLDNKHVVMLMPVAEDDFDKLQISRLNYPAGISRTQKMTSNHNQFQNAEQF